MCLLLDPKHWSAGIINKDDPELSVNDGPVPWLDRFYPGSLKTPETAIQFAKEQLGSFHVKSFC